MGAGVVNLLALGGAVAIVAGVISVTYIASRHRGGRKRNEMAKPSKASQRKVNPKTGDLFP